MLADYERAAALEMLEGLPLREGDDADAAGDEEDEDDDGAMPRLSLADARALARAALARAHAAEPMLGGQAFQAWLGSHSMARARLGWSREDLAAAARKCAVSASARFCQRARILRSSRSLSRYALEALALDEVPSIEPSTLAKMGLRGVEGLPTARGVARGERRGGDGRARRAGGGADRRRELPVFQNRP